MDDVVGTTPSERRRRKIARRRYLIDPRRQLKTVVLTTAVVAVLVVLVDFGFAALLGSQLDFLSAAAPQLRPVIDRQQATWSIVMLVSSVMLVVAVFAKAVIDTHRTAGAVFALRQRFDRVRHGDLRVTLRLRRNDHLADLERPFNEMMAAIRQRVEADADRLDELAERLRSTEAERESVADELESMASSLRETAG